MELLRKLFPSKKNMMLYIISNVTEIVTMTGERHRDFIDEVTKSLRKWLLHETKKPGKIVKCC